MDATAQHKRAILGVTGPVTMPGPVRNERFEGIGQVRAESAGGSNSTQLRGTTEYTTALNIVRDEKGKVKTSANTQGQRPRPRARKKRRSYEMQSP